MYAPNPLFRHGILWPLCGLWWLLVTAAARGLPPDQQGAARADVAFLESNRCAVCHANSSRAQAMRDQDGKPLAPYDLWRATAMANSVRDPFWRAVVSAEVAATPTLKSAIEEKCTRCHAPMAGPAPDSPPGGLLAHLAADDVRGGLGRDGVSCTLCHQMRAERLGTEASFTGGFVVGPSGPIYGPHDEPFTRPMQQHTGFTPTYSRHMLSAALCATCHTLNTQAVRPDGTATGHLLHEQSPYLEWRNSVFNDEREVLHRDARSCQACHMPSRDDLDRPIATPIAHNPGGRDWPFLPARSPFGRHLFLGGNGFLTRVLQRHRDELSVPVPEPVLSNRLEAITSFLEQRAAQLSFGDIERQGEQLRIPLQVTNLAGHKLPTAYPSRRVWLRVEVRDRHDRLILASGRFNQEGELIGSTGLPLASEQAAGPCLPHYRQIEASDQVQVYESIMADESGQETFRLLRGATYCKDNRLLPRGWQGSHSDASATEPAGTADDSDFVGGADSVVYIVPAASAPLRVTAALHYQVIAPRFAAELFRVPTAEVRDFQRLYRSVSRLPETLATVERQVP